MTRKRKKHIVYLIESPSGKFYVGRTCNFITRMNVHKNMSDDCRKLNNAIKTYGWDAFDVSILEDDLTYEEAIVREPYFVSLLQTVEYGYNILRGGKGFGTGEECINFGRKHTDEHRQKNADAKKGSKNPNFGKPRGEEVSKKISDGQPNKMCVVSTYIYTDMTMVFDTIGEASKSTGVHSGRISSIVNEKPELIRNKIWTTRKQAQGYTFKKLLF